MNNPVPKVGDVIYVGTSVYLSHGADDFIGGKAKVIEVKEGISGGQPAMFVRVEQRPSTSYNWEFLGLEQEKLKAQFGDEWSHADPDDRPEFNRWD